MLHVVNALQLRGAKIIFPIQFFSSPLIFPKPCSTVYSHFLFTNARLTYFCKARQFSAAIVFLSSEQGFNPKLNPLQPPLQASHRCLKPFYRKTLVSNSSIFGAIRGMATDKFESPDRKLREADEILTVWFGDWPRSVRESEKEPISWEDSMQKFRLWFMTDPEVDAKIKSQFSHLFQPAALGELSVWEETPHGSLSFIILLDQFTRNCFRNSGQAFAYDNISLAAAQRAIEKGFDKKVPIPLRAFFYLPFEHSEDLGHQSLAVKYFQQMIEDAAPNQKELADRFYDYSLRHEVVIKKFGRFPHRNELLGRESTADEVEYLKRGSWF